MNRSPLFALTLLALVACDGASDGTPPTIADLTYQPDRDAAGERFHVNGTLLFDDPDGDVTAIAFQLTSPDGTTTPPTSSPVHVHGGGFTQGLLALTVSVLAPTAGTYTFDVWVEDEAGHASNTLRGTIVAE